MGGGRQGHFSRGGMVRGGRLPETARARVMRDGRIWDASAEG